MTDSALLKIDWASKHIAKLNELLREKRPFTFVVETNTQARKRFLFVKENKPAIIEAALMCGDIVHNLRSALDHAYWEIILPHCTTDEERRRVQFPFASKAKWFGKSMKNRYATRAGTGFVCAVLRARPYGNKGGNELLHLVHELNVVDKHRLLIPSIDDSELSNAEIKKRIPDWPSPPNASIRFSGFKGRIEWAVGVSATLDPLGEVAVPTTNLFKREVDFPINIVIEIGTPGNLQPMVPALDKMVEIVRKAILLIRAAKDTY